MKYEDVTKITLSEFIKIKKLTLKKLLTLGKELERSYTLGFKNKHSIYNKTKVLYLYNDILFSSLSDEEDYESFRGNYNGFYIFNKIKKTIINE